MVNELTILDADKIRSKIYTIRNLQVMLDKDLANLYDVKPIRLREQVKRNIDRFPLDFMFQLDEKEVGLLVSQNAIASKKHLGGSLPYVFTEQGVANLSSVLTNKKAIQINIQIMRAFITMRRFLVSNAQIFERLNSVERKQVEYDKKLDKIFEAIEYKEIKPKKGIFFDGQIFDAYKFVSDLIRSAEKSIVLIDNYIDDSVSVKKFKNSHDRFIIIDNKGVYHFGASLKDLGKKWFGFSKFDKEVFKLLKELGL